MRGLAGKFSVSLAEKIPILIIAKGPPKRAFLMWLGCQDSNLGMLVSETRALPLGDTPKVQDNSKHSSCNKMVATTGFEPVTPSL